MCQTRACSSPGSAGPQDLVVVVPSSTDLPRSARTRGRIHPLRDTGTSVSIGVESFARTTRAAVLGVTLVASLVGTAALIPGQLTIGRVGAAGGCIPRQVLFVTGLTVTGRVPSPTAARPPSSIPVRRTAPDRSLEVVRAPRAGGCLPATTSSARRETQLQALLRRHAVGAPGPCRPGVGRARVASARTPAYPAIR
jgi:hypothetical protein